MNKKNGYLKEAENLLKYAEKEIEIARNSNDTVLGMQICEKAYLALLKIINALFIKKGLEKHKLPKSERGRLFMLKNYGTKDLRVKYESLRHYFHIDGFHEEIIEFDDISERLNDLNSLMETVKSS